MLDFTRAFLISPILFATLLQTGCHVISNWGTIYQENPCNRKLRHFLLIQIRVSLLETEAGMKIRHRIMTNLSNRCKSVPNGINKIV